MSYNLYKARMAVDYVYNTARIRAFNRSEGINRKPESVRSGKVSLGKYLSDTRKGLKLSDTSDGYARELKETTEVAEKAGVGNCSEQVAVAFNYLRKQQKQGNMAVMKLSDCHVFLILGLSSIPILKQSQRVGWVPFKGGIPKEAVVCDPWCNECFIMSAAWKARVPHMTFEANRSIAESNVTPSMPVRGMYCQLTCLGYT